AVTDVPAGGAINNVLQKNTAADYDTGWTGDPSVNSLTAAGNGNSTGNNTFGQIDARRINGAGALVALQTAGVFRGLGWDGVSAYQVLATLAFGAEQNTSPTGSGGYLQFQTTPNGTTGTIARLRVGQDGTIRI